MNLTSTPITLSIIVLTSIVSLVAMGNARMLSKLMMNPYRIHHNREYYRFITSGFVHIDHMHLIFNMYSFYFFGSAIEYMFSYLFTGKGPAYFIGLYLLAIVTSDLPTYFKQKENPQYNSLGASGGVAALILAFILYQPLQTTCIFVAFCMPGFILGALFILFSYVQGRRSKDAINHDAHLYGALTGLAFCIATNPLVVVHFAEQVKNWSYFRGF